MIQQFHLCVYTQNWKALMRYLYTQVHRSTIHSDQKAEATQASTDGQ